MMDDEDNTTMPLSMCPEGGEGGHLDELYALFCHVGFLTPTEGCQQKYASSIFVVEFY